MKKITKQPEPQPRKRGGKLLYGEETETINVRVPKKKKAEILGRFYGILKEYEV